MDRGGHVFSGTIGAQGPPFRQRLPEGGRRLSDDDVSVTSASVPRAERVVRKRPREAIVWLRTHPTLEELCRHYPTEWAVVQQSIAEMQQRGGQEELRESLRAALRTAPHARDRQVSQGERVSAEVRRQMLVQAVRRASLIASTGVSTGSVRFGLVSGWILQRLLFRRALERKPVSMTAFRAIWPLLRQRRFLMPLVRPQGIYCFYSASLLTGLKDLVDDRPCVEIAAGDGTLSRLLRNVGVDVTATDDGSWSGSIDYPSDVVKESARTSLAKRSPRVVICSWPPPSLSTWGEAPGSS